MKYLIKYILILCSAFLFSSSALSQKYLKDTNDIERLQARKIIKKKIIGITCHNSVKLAKLAINNKADYIAFGAFYTSKTKKTKFKANLSLLKKIRKITKTPIVAIGGINSENYKKLLLNKANFLAISGYIWNNKKLKPIEAIKKLMSRDAICLKSFSLILFT